MTTESSKNQRDEEVAVNRDNGIIEDEDDGSVISDDGSHSSSESSSDDSSTDESSPPPESINGDQIRQNARELLQASPNLDLDKKKHRSSATAAIFNPTTGKANSGDYQSYHDAPTVRMSSTSQFSNSDSFPTSSPSTPPWAHANSNESVEGLSTTDVVTMAFTCVAHCLTEGYRAASNYYSGYQPEHQYPSVGPNSSQNYQHVGGGIYQNETYNNSSSSSSYQTKFSDGPGEVMDRGMASQYASQSTGQDTEQGTQPMMEQREEWAHVQVPSTYQGGRV